MGKDDKTLKRLVNACLDVSPYASRETWREFRVALKEIMAWMEFQDRSNRRRV